MKEMDGIATAEAIAASAASVPAAMHDGLPIGVQIVAPMFREDRIFAVAQQLEEAVGWLDWFSMLDATQGENDE